MQESDREEEFPSSSFSQEWFPAATQSSHYIEQIQPVQPDSPEQGDTSRAADTSEEADGITTENVDEIPLDTPLAFLSPSKRLQMLRNRERRGRRGETIAQAIMENARQESTILHNELLQHLDRDSVMMDEIVSIVRDDAISSKEDRKQLLACMKTVSDLASYQMLALKKKMEHGRCHCTRINSKSEKSHKVRRSGKAMCTNRPSKLASLGLEVSSGAPEQNQCLLPEGEQGTSKDNNAEVPPIGRQGITVSERSRQRKKLQRYSP